MNGFNYSVAGIIRQGDEVLPWCLKGVLFTHK